MTIQCLTQNHSYLCSQNSLQPSDKKYQVILETFEHLNQATLCLDGTCMGDRLGAHGAADKSQSENHARFETRRQQELFTAISQ